MDRVRGQAQPTTATSQSAHRQRSSRLALTSRHAAGAMSDEELVNQLVVAGRGIFAQTDLAPEVQDDILTGIASIVGKKLSNYELRSRRGGRLARTDRGASARAVAKRKADAARVCEKGLSNTASAAELAAMKLKERRQFLDRHYKDRTRWAQVRPKRPQEPTPDDFQRWVDGNFPDRRQLGLVLSDLTTLDKEAYGKLRRWASPTGNTVKIDPAQFGFPSKVVRYDPSKPVPTGAEVFDAFKRGDPEAVELRRDYMRARYHLQRNTYIERRADSGASRFSGNINGRYLAK
jgi:hypothetical protein